MKQNTKGIQRRHFAAGALATFVAGCESNSSRPARATSLNNANGGPVPSRRIASFQRDASISLDGNSFACCKETQGGNEISILNLIDGSEKVLRFSNATLAYGPALNEDGTKLAVLLQNERYHNYLIVLNLVDFSIIDTLHIPLKVHLLPIFIEGNLYYFLSDEAGEKTISTRFLSGVTEPNSIDEQFKFYRYERDAGNLTQALDASFYSPSSLRLFNSGVLLTRGTNEFSNHNISSDLPAARLVGKIFDNSFYEFAEHDAVTIINNHKNKVFVDDAKIKYIPLNYETFFGKYSKVTFRELNYSVRSADDIRGVGAISQPLETIINAFSNLVFVTSSKRFNVFAGVDPSTQKYSFVFLDENFSTLSIHRYDSPNTSKIDINTAY